MEEDPYESLKFPDTNRGKFKCQIHRNQNIQSISIQALQDENNLKLFCTDCIKQIQQNLDKEDVILIDFPQEFVQNFKLKIDQLKQKKDHKAQNSQLIQKFKDYYDNSLKIVDELAQNLKIFQNKIERDHQNLINLITRDRSQPLDVLNQILAKISKAVDTEQLELGLKGLSEISQFSNQVFPLTFDQFCFVGDSQLHEFSKILDYKSDLNKIYIQIESLQCGLKSLPTIEEGFQQKALKLSEISIVVPSVNVENLQVSAEQKNPFDCKNFYSLRAIGENLCGAIGNKNTIYYLFLFQNSGDQFQKLCEFQVGKTLRNSLLNCIEIIDKERIICGFYRILYIINVTTLKIQTTFDTKLELNIYTLCLGINGFLYLALSKNDIGVYLFQQQGFDIQSYQVLIGHSNSIFVIQEVGEGEIISCSRDNTVRVWDVQNNQPISRIIVKLSHGIFDFQLAQSLKKMYLVGSSQNIYEVTLDGNWKETSKPIDPVVLQKIEDSLAIYSLELTQQGMFLGTFSKGVLYYDFSSNQIQSFGYDQTRDGSTDVSLSKSSLNSQVYFVDQSSTNLVKMVM